MTDMNYKSFMRDVENWVARKALPYLATGAIAGTMLFGTHVALPNGYHNKPKPKARVVQRDLDYKSKITFVSNRDGNPEIYIMDSDGKHQKRLTHDKSSDISPSWSPDGKHIAFVSDRDGNYQVYIMNVSGSNQRRLTHDKSSDISPSWSPDGKHIAFVSDRDGNEEIYVMNADGSDQRNLTKSPEDETGPAWSPDGKYIAFSSASSGEYESPPFLYLISKDGTWIEINTMHWAQSQPAWAPSGKRIAFVALDKGVGNDEIFILDMRSHTEVNVTNNTSDDDAPVWQPIPKRVRK